MLGRSAHRTERVVYRPNLGATSLTFELTAGSTSNTIAYGQREVTVQPNVTTFAEIVLSAGVGPDGERKMVATTAAVPRPRCRSSPRLSSPRPTSPSAS